MIATETAARSSIRRRIAKLERVTVARGATAGEAANAKSMAERLRAQLPKDEQFKASFDEHIDRANENLNRARAAGKANTNAKYSGSGYYEDPGPKLNEEFFKSFWRSKETEDVWWWGRQAPHDDHRDNQEAEARLDEIHREQTANARFSSVLQPDPRELHDYLSKLAQQRGRANQQFVRNPNFGKVFKP